jgi:hypothetical protein
VTCDELAHEQILLRLVKLPHVAAGEPVVWEGPLQAEETIKTNPRVYADSLRLFPPP